MNLSSQEILTRLGAGDPIAAVGARAGWSREQFDAWWREECRQRVRAVTGAVRARGLRGRVRIGRDRWGIPHIEADSDPDLFFGFGYATAQDRLFQLDYLRRKACGRLAEVLGPEGLESDLLYRTLGLAQIAEAEWQSLSDQTRDLLAAYAAGINAVIDASRAIAGEFRWYLTGRFPVLVIPELVKRALGDGPLYRAFLQGEADDESILPPGSYPASRCGGERGGETISDRE